MAARLRRVEQSGSLVGDHGEAFVQVGVAGRPADLVVDGQLDDPGAVEQPAQDQDRVGGSSPASGCRPWSRGVGVRRAAELTRTQPATGRLRRGTSSGFLCTRGRWHSTARRPGSAGPSPRTSALTCWHRTEGLRQKRQSAFTPKCETETSWTARTTCTRSRDTARAAVAARTRRY